MRALVLKAHFPFSCSWPNINPFIDIHKTNKHRETRVMEIIGYSIYCRYNLHFNAAEHSNAK